MSDDRTGPSRRRWASAGPLVLVIVAAIGAFWWWQSGADDPLPEPLEIAASGPRFATIDDLLSASDLVVRATVTAVADGRQITDPADPTSGISTQLAHVEVDEIIRGAHDGPLIVEQEAALLDGTPVRVNGVDPLRVGDTGLMFLVRGESDEFPYTAMVNEQGWLPIVDGGFAPTDHNDPLWHDLPNDIWEVTSGVRPAM